MSGVLRVIYHDQGRAVLQVLPASELGSRSKGLDHATIGKPDLVVSPDRPFARRTRIVGSQQVVRLQLGADAVEVFSCLLAGV